MRTNTLKIPSLSSVPKALWVQLVILSTYAIGSRALFRFERPHSWALATIAAAMGTDLLLGALRYRTLRVPVAGAIIGCACSILIDSRFLGPYLFAAIVAVGSKAFILRSAHVDPGALPISSHIFNPANFGVVLALQLLPGLTTGIPELFSGLFLPSVVMATLGSLVVTVAGQWPVSLAWLTGFAVLAPLRSWHTGAPLHLSLAPALGPAFLLFTFHMISDPATTPRSLRGKWLFGASVAVVDTLYRLLEIPFGNFYALFWISALSASGAALWSCLPTRQR